MNPKPNRPTVRTIGAAETQPTAVGDVGTQRILLGEPHADGSPLFMGITMVRAGQTSVLIEHDTAEVAYVLTGSGSMITDATTHSFATGDAILIEAHCWHAIRAGEESVQMLYVFPTPAPPPTRTCTTRPQ